MKEIGVYIHIPFCKKKCNYCDFISFANKESFINKYVEALKKEIVNSIKLKTLENVLVKTIYIGGGTPSYLDSNFIVSILNEVKNKYNVEKSAEITIEVNPGTITKEKLEEYYKAGINRLSIGLQSDNDEILNNIGRIHNYSDFLKTYELSRNVGFKNINIDLMLALPSQTLDVLKDTVDNIIKLNPEHISVYSLILEDGTKLKEQVECGKVNLPDEETERKMYYLVQKMLEEKGYYQYEISNFSKIGYESKHNLNYWNQKEYIGYGVASHSYIDNERFSNTISIEEYIKNIENGEIEKNYTINEIQDKTSKMNEYMMLGLRKISGVSIKDFKQEFSENPIFLYKEILSKLVNEELIEIDLDSIKLTKKGLDFANLVWEEFV